MVKIRDLIRTITDNGALLTAMGRQDRRQDRTGLIREGLIRTGPAAGSREIPHRAPRDREHPGDARTVFRMGPRLPDSGSMDVRRRESRIPACRMHLIQRRTA